MVMQTLVLSPYPDLIVPTISKSFKTNDGSSTRSATLEVEDWPEADWVVCFGYRKIIPDRIIRKFEGRIINIHCSALPYNRGAKPNFWSWFDGTPSGVTIHRVTPALDAGPILAQTILYEDDFRQPGATLRTTYEDLLVAAAGLFAASWKPIIQGGFGPSGPIKNGPGTFHKEGDEMPFFRFLSRDWDAPISEVKQLGAIYRRAAK